MNKSISLLGSLLALVAPLLLLFAPTGSAASPQAVATRGSVAPALAPNVPADRKVQPGIDPDSVRLALRRVADWQMMHPWRYEPDNWTMAPLYDGLIDTSLVLGDPEYMAAVIRAGVRISFAPGAPTYHADTQAAGHAWLRLYQMDPSDPSLLTPFKERFDEILAKPIKEPLALGKPPSTKGVDSTDRWTWADAIYMAPPTLALLSNVTGDDRYIKFADSEFQDTVAALYDKDAHLFWRDARFVGAKAPNGEKEFWSRGNGWVYAGLASVLTDLPKNYSNRSLYEDIYKEMGGAVRASQHFDGFWYPNMLDPNDVPIGETSGTALFVFGMARGISLGILDFDTYWPAIERGWYALLTAVKPSGEVDSTQPIAAEPKPFPQDNSEPYGTGAVLLAGSEILRVLGGAARVNPAELRDDAATLQASAPDLSSVPPKQNKTPSESP